MSRTRSRSIRSKMATRPKLPHVCFRCRRFPGCGERNKNDEARSTKDEGRNPKKRMKIRFGCMVKRCSFVKNQTPSPSTIWESEQRVSGKMSLISQRRFHRPQQRTASLANRSVRQQVSARTMSEPMTPFPKENFSSVLVPARKRRVKRSIFCVWPSARFQN